MEPSAIAPAWAGLRPQMRPDFGRRGMVGTQAPCWGRTEATPALTPTPFSHHNAPFSKQISPKKSPVKIKQISGAGSADASCRTMAGWAEPGDSEAPVSQGWGAPLQHPPVITHPAGIHCRLQNAPLLPQNSTVRSSNFLPCPQAQAGGLTHGRNRTRILLFIFEVLNRRDWKEWQDKRIVYNSLHLQPAERWALS